ncbi:serine protease filzig [Sitodiplosis mosellana]|uniref:serine protease filzig n=1 Tax=Sitodiplosis mosellana TaxID=263140 RepID=UPI0024439264|nr:serine protease filzig [Sitodiplosis mosellana]
MKLNRMTMTSLKCSLRLQPYRQWFFVLYFVLITIIDFSYTVDGLSTTNDRGERKLFGGYRITPKFCKPSKILPKGDPRAEGPTICMFNHECSQRHGEVVGACMDGFLFGACCQLAVNEAVIDDYNKPLLNPLEPFNGNDNHVPSNDGSYGESDTVLIETSQPTTPEKTSIYLSSHSTGQVYSPELPTQVTDSLTTFGTLNPNKKKVPNTKQPHQTKPTPSKYGTTDKYVLVQTLTNDKNGPSSKPGGPVYDNEINSIESIILMLNDSKTGPQYNTDGKPQSTYEYTSSGLPTKYGSSSSSGSFYITTKLPSSTTPVPISYVPSTKRPPLYNVTYTTSQNAITSLFTPSSTPSTLATVFQKIPILTHTGPITTKSPSTSYVYSTAIPKRPTSSSSNPNRISSTTTATKKPTKLATTNTKKPVQKGTTRPISTSYVSGPTPSRPTYSATKKPAPVSSYTTPNRPQSSEVPVINKIGSSTPAPTVIVLGPYGIGSTENPSPTIHITPKPTASHFVSSSTSWTVSPDLNKYTPPKIPNTSQYVSYSPILTKRPGQSEPSIYTPGGGPILSNDFDDPGYYGLASTTQRPLIANIQQTVTSASIYAVLDENGFPATATPNEEVYTSPNDLINFPPVRNPNLNGTAQIASATIEDYDISTPQFIEDELLNDKMNLLVNKIVESLKDNFHDLADIVENKTVTRRPAPSATTIQQRPITTLATKKPPQRATTTTTRRPSTLSKPSTSRPVNNRKTTKKPPTTVLNRVTTTKRPTTKPPKRQPTTTVQQQYDEVTDAVEEEEEDVGEETGEEESTPYFESGRVQCGVRPHVKSGRIVGGKGATFGEWPWQVLVRESTWLGLFTKNKCGGVLITKNYVMTAAHCQPGFLASLVAVFGEFDISGDVEKKRSVTKNVKHIVVHREYDAATFENDLALLELESPIHYDTHIVPICMPVDGTEFTGRMATVTGWGRLKYGGGVPSVLQEVQVPIIENSVCQEMFHTAGHNKKILPSFLCAGYANGQKDSCEGDSGGPLVLQRSDGRWELAGTVSHGIKCAAPYLPGVYMRTTYYKPWLESITGV